MDSTAATIYDRIDPALTQALVETEEQVTTAQAQATQLEERLRQPAKLTAQLEQAEERQTAAEQARAAAQQARDAAYAEQWRLDYDQAMHDMHAAVADVDGKLAAWQRESTQRRREWADEIEAAVNRRNELAAVRPPSLASDALYHDGNETQDALRRVREARMSAERRAHALEGKNSWN